jgi:DNA-binding MarR family transcriptional regulator
MIKLRKKIITKNYKRIEPKQDWLKYWRVVRFWVREAYGLSYPDLEMLLFLYSEDLFSYKDFERYELIMSWDVVRFQRLSSEGWITKWRKHSNKQCALYTLSFKGKSLISSVYRKLSGLEVISESPTRNPIFKKSASPQSQIYREMIIEMNNAIREAKKKMK